jgi:hypothetical protein
MTIETGYYIPDLNTRRMEKNSSQRLYRSSKLDNVRPH